VADENTTAKRLMAGLPSSESLRMTHVRRHWDSRGRRRSYVLRIEHKLQSRRPCVTNAATHRVTSPPP
jgi:hypothetical protein